MNTVYDSAIQTYKNICAPQDKEKGLLEMLSDLGPLFQDYVMKGILSAKEDKPMSIMDFVPDDQKSTITTEAQAKAFCEAMGIKINPQQVGSIVLGKDKIMSFISFDTCTAPDKKGVSQQCFRIREASKKNPGEETTGVYRRVEPTNGITYLYHCTVGTQIYNARKQDGVKVLCQAAYNRFPQVGESHGFPVHLPAWLKPGEGCDNCRYAPHLDKEARTAMDRKDRCLAYSICPTFIYGTVEKEQGWFGPSTFQISGVWGNELWKTVWGTKPFWTKIVPFGKITFSQKKERVMEVLLPESTQALFTEGTIQWNAARSITAAFRTNLNARCKPTGKAAAYVNMSTENIQEGPVPGDPLDNL